MKQSRLFLSAVLALVLGLTSWASADTGLDVETIRAAVEGMSRPLLNLVG